MWPKFMQVAADLGAQIDQGHLSGRLPTERELCHHFSVSRVTLRRALSTLAESGHIRASWGRGWYVVREPISEPPNALLSFSELASGKGLLSSTRVLHVETRPAVLERLRFLDSVPAVLQRSHLALARVEGLAEVLSSLDLTHVSLYRLLEERWGLVAARADYVVEARSATATEAELLDVAPGSPLLQATQTTFDPENNPFERHWSTYPGDRYRFEARLLRPVRPKLAERSGAASSLPLASAGTAVRDGKLP